MARTPPAGDGAAIIVTRCPTAPTRRGMMPAWRARRANHWQSQATISDPSFETSKPNHGGPMARRAARVARNIWRLISPSRPCTSRPPLPMARHAATGASQTTSSAVSGRGMVSASAMMIAGRRVEVRKSRMRRLRHTARRSGTPEENGCCRRQTWRNCEAQSRRGGAAAPAPSRITSSVLCSGFLISQTEGPIHTLFTFAARKWPRASNSQHWTRQPLKANSNGPGTAWRMVMSSMQMSIQPSSKKAGW